MNDKKTARRLKGEPIAITLSPAARETLTLAAAVFGTDLAGYVRKVLHQKAKEIRRRSTITLSLRDMRALAEAARNPARPNAALKRAVHQLRRFRKPR